MLESGYTQNEIDELRQVDFSDAVMELAANDEETLSDMGYSASDIEILKEYDGSPITPDSEVYAALANISGLLVCKGASQTSITFEYQWKWDKVPATNKSDSVAMRWKAYHSSGTEISVSVTSSSHTVNYVGGTTISKSIAVTRNGQMQGASSKFDRFINQNGLYYYAMNGKMQIAVKRDGSVPLTYIKVSRAYAHVTYAVTTSPSITVNMLAGSLAISFSGAVTTTISTLDDNRIIRINSNGNMEDA